MNLKIYNKNINKNEMSFFSESMGTRSMFFRVYVLQGNLIMEIIAFQWLLVPKISFRRADHNLVAIVPSSYLIPIHHFAQHVCKHCDQELAVLAGQQLSMYHSCHRETRPCSSICQV